MHTENVKIALVDDHTIFRKALQNFLPSLGNYTVVLEARDGLELQEAVQNGTRLDVILLDISMPGMDGFETIKWLHETHPELAVVILSDRDTEITTFFLIYHGARAILKKNAELSEIQKAISAAADNGFYFPDAATRNPWKAIHHDKGGRAVRRQLFSGRQWRFLQLAGTDLTYANMADQLDTSEACVKKVQHEMFEELNVTNRAALAVLAERHGIREHKAA